MTETTTPETSIQKFRRTYPRVDYFPDVEAHKVIQRMRLAKPGKSTRELIDALVCAGGKTYFSETGVVLKHVQET